MDDLVKRLEALDDRGDNDLDVLCEVAFFKPGTRFTSIRANNAGTKVIYTNKAGNDVTCWAESWSELPSRASTIAALRALQDRKP